MPARAAVFMNFRLFRFCMSFAVLGASVALHADMPSNATPPPGSSDIQPGATPDVATDPNHVLVPQDILRVQVFQEEDINKQCDPLVVSQDGSLTLPLIGTISVKGKTIHQTRELIRSLYDRDFLVNPQVTIQVLKYAERFVNVLGSVTKQGRIDFPDTHDLTIVDAITLAGGPTRLADLEQVKLTRTDEHGEKTVTVIDVDALMNKHGGTPVMLQPGDIVYVPERVL